MFKHLSNALFITAVIKATNEYLKKLFMDRNSIQNQGWVIHQSIYHWKVNFLTKWMNYVFLFIYFISHLSQGKHGTIFYTAWNFPRLNIIFNLNKNFMLSKCIVVMNYFCNCVNVFIIIFESMFCNTDW